MTWTETYRGTVHRWEVDNVDHFTVAYYFARFEDAALGMLHALGLGRDALGPGRAAVVTECRVRYLRELRVGDVLAIRSGVIAADGGGIILGHEVVDSGDGALCTTVEQRVIATGANRRTPVALSRAALDLAHLHRVDWEGGPTPAIAQTVADDARLIDAARDTLKPWEVDAEGFAALPAFIHRFTAANGHVLAAFGMTPAYMRSEQRGFSTFEFRLALHGALRAGDFALVRSGLGHVGSSSMRILHRMTEARTGALVATLDQAGVSLDLAARRPAPLPAELRARALAMLVAPRAAP